LVGIYIVAFLNAVFTPNSGSGDDVRHAINTYVLPFSFVVSMTIAAAATWWATGIPPRTRVGLAAQIGRSLLALAAAVVVFWIVQLVPSPKKGWSIGDVIWLPAVVLSFGAVMWLTRSWQHHQSRRPPPD